MENDLLQKRSCVRQNLVSNNVYSDNRFKKGNNTFKSKGGIIDLVELALNYEYSGIKLLLKDLKEEVLNFKYFVNWPIVKHHQKTRKAKYKLILRSRKNKKPVNLDFIKEKLDNDDIYATSLAKLHKLYNKTFPSNKISYSTFFRSVKNDIKYKFNTEIQGPIKKQYKEILPEIIIFLLRFIRHFNKGTDIYFYDESTIRNYTVNRKFWSNRRKYRKRSWRNINKLKINLLYICSFKSTLHYALRKQNTKSYAVNMFLQSAINKIHKEEDKDILICIDNARYHIKDELEEIGKKNGITFLFLPRYAPFCNLAENAFCLIKRKFKDLDVHKSNRIKKFEKNFEGVIKAIRFKDFNIIFSHYIKYLNNMIHDLMLL